MYRIRRETNKRIDWGLEDGTGLMTEVDDCGSPPTGLGGRIAKRSYEIRAGEHAPNHFPLDADAAAVNDTEPSKTEPVRFREVFLDYSLHVARRHGMEVKDVGDGNTDRVF